MCEPMYDDRDLPVCPCGGDIFLYDNDNEEGFLVWGKCEKCERIGEKFDNVDDALDECYTWK